MSGQQVAGVKALFDGLRAGERRALGQALTLVETGGAEARALVALCREANSGGAGGRQTARLGLTGAPGAGKSTLLEALARLLRDQGRTVGILAVDPSSPLSGGAILGDRIRMGEFASDDGVFIRSMATRGHLGGLAAAADDALAVMAVSGKDVLLIETTGVGQGEVEIAQFADAVGVVMAPGMGDGVQAMKAGVLEIASVLVLNKADREGMDRLEQEMTGMEALTHAVTGRAGRAVVKTVATRGEGVGELLEALEAAAVEGRGRRVDRSASGEWETATVPVRDQPVLDHLGIAVRSLDEAEGLYRLLGLTALGRETIAAEGVRVAMLEMGAGKTGASRIELLEPIDAANSTVGRFLARRGEGLHHVALRVSGLEAVVERLKANGVRLVSEQIQVGAGGHRYVFVHPASAHGVLLELVEEMA